jgi:hypothetical protein
VTSAHETHDADSGDVGSAAEEAARLIAALQEWAGRAMSAVDGHIATGSEECRLCPICQGISLLRTANPEAFGHLSDAAASLTAALRAALADYGRSERPPVQHIDVE